MSTDLTRIREKARKQPDLVFTSLYHHVTDLDNLRSCYEALDGDKAVGVDGVTKEQYGEDLEEKLQCLSDRLKRMGYHPQPRRRSYIPKPGSEKGRPLGISCFEDKIVELAVKQVLEPIYEEIFEDSSYGYRPGRSQHLCLDKLGRTIQQRRVSHVVESDIRGFFDEVSHNWVLKFLEHRIGDPRILRLISRMLKGGIMEAGLVQASEKGTPQGSILSPLLSNIYLHYVLDLWFSRRIKKQCQGEAYYFRFADDFLACFQHKGDAEHFKNRLNDRLDGFGLRVAEEKTRCIEFGRFARAEAQRRGQKPDEFTFLGFTHYCGKTRKRNFRVKEARPVFLPPSAVRGEPIDTWPLSMYASIIKKHPTVGYRRKAFPSFQIFDRIKNDVNDYAPPLYLAHLCHSLQRCFSSFCVSSSLENSLALGVISLSQSFSN